MKTGDIEMEIHAKIKHKILEEYLKAWFPIVGKSYDACIYVDSLAGSGEILLKNGQISEGSPIVVLKMLKSHILSQKIKNAIIIFIEIDEKSVEKLNEKIKNIEIPDNIEVFIETGDFHEKINEVIKMKREISYSGVPMFVFIDPYGYSIKMETIQEILKMKSSEVLITFMYSYVNRAVSSGFHDEKLNMLFGSNEWEEARELTKPDERRKFLVSLFESKLKEVAKYTLYFEIRDKNNRTYYLLFFATNSLKGIEAMKRAMWNNSLFESEFTWSDRVPLTQTTLFEKEPNTKLIEKEIMEKFCGTTVKLKEIERFILLETPYLTTHYKKPLKSLEKKGIIIVPNNKRKKRYTYPDPEMEIYFVC